MIITKELLLKMKATFDVISSKQGDTTAYYQKIKQELNTIYASNKEIGCCLFVGLTLAADGQLKKDLYDMAGVFDLEDDLKAIESTIKNVNVEAVEDIDDDIVYFSDNQQCLASELNMVKSKYSRYELDEDINFELGMLKTIDQYMGYKVNDSDYIFSFGPNANKQVEKEDVIDTSIKINNDSDLLIKIDNKKEVKNDQPIDEDNFIFNCRDLSRIKGYYQKLVRVSLPAARMGKGVGRYCEELLDTIDDILKNPKNAEEKQNAICLLTALSYADSSDIETINERLDNLGIDENIRESFFNIARFENVNVTAIRGVDKNGYVLPGGESVGFEDVVDELDKFEEYKQEKEDKVPLNLLYFQDRKAFGRMVDKNNYIATIEGIFPYVKPEITRNEDDPFYIEGTSEIDLNSNKIFATDIKKQLRDAHTLYDTYKRSGVDMTETYNEELRYLAGKRNDTNYSKQVVNKMMPMYLAFSKAKSERSFFSYLNPVNWFKYPKQNRVINDIKGKLNEVAINDDILRVYKDQYNFVNPNQSFDSVEWNAENGTYTAKTSIYEEDAVERAINNDIVINNLQNKGVSPKQELEKDKDINIEIDINKG